MSKFKLWPSDATTIFEKVLYAAMHIVPAGLFVFMQFSAWGIFHNIYQKNVAAAPAGWHVLGFVLSVFTVVWTYAVASDSNKVTKSDIGNVIIMISAMAISLSAYAGFVFNG